MKNSYNLLTLFVLMVLISLTGAFATTQEDLINEARNGVSSWESGVSYTKDMVVSFDGILYKTLKGIISDNVNNPVTAANLYTPIKQKELVKLTTYKETKFKDKTIYTGDVSVKGLNLTGTEIFVSDRQLVGLADYNPEQFTVSIFTGNDGVKYSVYSYHNETDPNNLNTNRSFIRENGDYLFDVYSKDGFATYQTNGFSTQILAMPDVTLFYTNNIAIQINSYFDSYTEDEVFLDLADATYVSGDCVTLINQVCKMTKDGTDIVTDEYTATHEAQTTNDFLAITANSLPLTTLVSVAVNDGVDFLSDSFTLTITAQTTPAVSTVTTTSVGDTTATLNADITDMGGESILNYGFEYKQASSGTWIDVDLGTTIATGTYSHPLTGLTASTLYDFRAYMDDGVTTYTGSTLQFTTTGATGDLEVSTLAYYTFDENTGTTLFDSSPNNVDGTINGATWSVGQVNSDLSFDGVNDFVQLESDWGGHTNLLISSWYELDSSASGNNYILDDKNLRFRINPTGASILVWNDRTGGGAFTSYTGYTPTIGVKTHIAIVLQGNTARLFENDVEVTLTTGTGSVSGGVNNPTIGSFHTGAAEFFEGDIDELGLFDITSWSNLEIEDSISTLSLGTDAQQYPFNVVLSPPTQDATINNFALEVPAVASIDLDDYFTNFTSFTVTYDDPDSAGQIVLTGTSSDTSSTFTGETNGLTNVLTLTSIAEMTALNIEISVCNADGCISQTPTLTITEPLVPPVQISSLVGFAVVVPDSQLRDIDDWFTGFTSFTVQFTNPDDSQPVSLSGTATHTNSKFTIATNGLTNEITVTGIADITALPFTVQVTNTDGTIQDSSTITVSTTPLVPPVQISSLVGFTVTVPDSQVRDIDDWFTGFTGFTLQFTNPDDSQPVSLSGTATHTNSKFTIATNGLTNEITVTGIAEITALPFTVQVTNTDGTIQNSSTITVSLAVVEPTDVDVFLDGFGNTGSPIVRLIVGLMIVLALVVAGWYYTQTVFIGVFAGIIGLIITVAVGLISIWLVLLIILLALIPLIYIWVFGRGG